MFLDLQIKQSSYFDIVYSTQYNMTFIIKNELFARAKYKKIFLKNNIQYCVFLYINFVCGNIWFFNNKKLSNVYASLYWCPSASSSYLMTACHSKRPCSIALNIIFSASGAICNCQILSESDKGSYFRHFADNCFSFL